MKDLFFRWEFLKCHWPLYIFFLIICNFDCYISIIKFFIYIFKDNSLGYHNWLGTMSNEMDVTSLNRSLSLLLGLKLTQCISFFKEALRISWVDISPFAHRMLVLGHPSRVTKLYSANSYLERTYLPFCWLHKFSASYSINDHVSYQFWRYEFMCLVQSWNLMDITLYYMCIRKINNAW